MIKTGISHKSGKDSYKAGEEACKEALDNLGEDPSLILLFSTSKNYNPEEVLKGVNSVTGGDIPLVGGTAGWGIMNLKEEQEVTVNAFSFEKSEVHIDSSENLGEDHKEEGKKFAEKFVKDEYPKILIIFMASMGEIMPNAFLSGMKEVLGDNTDIIGGNTGDDAAMEEGGHQFINDKALKKGISGVGLYGDLEVDLKVEHGYEPLGFSKEITKTDKNIIHEIEGKPASSIYEDYFTKEEISGEDFFSAVEGKGLEGSGFYFPLGIISPERIIARYIIEANEDGSLVCGSDVEEGSKVRVLQAGAERIFESAKKMAEEIKKSNPECVLFFSCAIRRMIMMPEDENELINFKKGLEKEVPIVGFYTYGEFCTPKEEEALVHHETLAIAGIKEL